MLHLEHLGCFQLVDQSFVVVEVQTVVAVVVVEEKIVPAVAVVETVPAVAVVETVPVVAVVETVPEVAEIVLEVVAQAVLVDQGVAFGLVVDQRVYPRQRQHFLYMKRTLPVS